MNRLTTKEDWESRWNPEIILDIRFSPDRPFFREIHRTLQEYLPSATLNTFLEIGAYPGRFLWYFHHYFNLDPWGVEYVESLAEGLEKNLSGIDVPGKVICEDLFNLAPRQFGTTLGWDVVASFGFIEHFIDTREVIRKHFELTREGGLVIVTIPNHAGLNGRIMRLVDQDKWEEHNLNSLEDLLVSFREVKDCEILEAKYVTRIGFWNACIYRKMKDNLGFLYPIFRAPLWLIEVIGQYLMPNNKFTSPGILIIARKENHKSH